MPAIGVALSGGGHRATVWALGVLMYLVDSGCNRDVAVVSSVSGGSIANGVVAQRCDFTTTNPEQFRAAIRPAVQHIAGEGLFFWGRRTNAFLLATLTTLIIGVLLSAAWLVTAVAIGVRAVPAAVALAGIAGVALLTLGSWLFSQRSRVVQRALARVHFGSSPGPKLVDIAAGLDHVFCATDLVSGNHVYMSPRFVYSYRFGVGRPGGLEIAKAVQASACLPFAFAPRRMSARDLGFDQSTPMTGLLDELSLTDGGVYDNMADQWIAGLQARLTREPQLPVTMRTVDELIVVNAGGTPRLVPMRAAGLPGIGDVRTLRRVNDVLYAGTTAHRRQQLFVRSESAERSGQGQRSMILQTTQTPYTAADRHAGDAGERGERARAALRHLELHDDLGPEQWRARATGNAQVKTVLSRLGDERTVELLQHAYITAMYGLHVVLGHPLLAPPSRAEFEQMVHAPAA